MTTLLEKLIKQKKGTVTLTMAQALVLYLTKQKVELHDGSIVPFFGGVWGIYGHGNVAGIGEALWKYREEIPYFRGQNEQGMAHAAIAFAKSHRARRVMGVTSSIGPGATNMVTAAALAHVNRLPVLFLPGDIFASRRPDPVLQQLEDSECPLTSVNDCFAPVSRYFDRIMRPEQLIESLPQAMRTLLYPADRGPVTLALPQDTQTESWDYPESFFEETIHYLQRPRPDSRSVVRSTVLLKKAEKPLIIAGGGVHYSGAEPTLQKFAETHGIPVTETQAGKTSLPWDHPLNLGAIGVTGTSAANAYAKDADLILCVGTRLSDFTTASKSLFHRGTTKFVQINVTAFDATKTQGESIIADAQEGLTALSEVLGRQKWEFNLQPLQDEWENIYQESTKDCLGLPSDTQVLAAVNQCCEETDIMICAAGGLPGELHKNWRSRDPISYHLEYGYSCMGYEIAGAVGIKMAHPDREVYVLVGDGSYLMLHTELLTAIQQDLKINVVLLDNRGFGCINRLQKGCGSPAFGNLLARSADFVQNAKSYGCHAEKAGSLDELKTILKKNRSEKQTCVTVIDTDPQKSSPGHAWWDVAIAEKSDESTVRDARNAYLKTLEEICESN
ncbi:MAG: 3D-(3,5/4)-trihydroxycyclohexane-1,2-dione hydrolase [Chlamydiae bacterium]|nr:3D-(3,5/4)-trihydroxycyclohexane-1,2-dione hydrolase [Chlamydiota bacterium]